MNLSELEVIELVRYATDLGVLYEQMQIENKELKAKYYDAKEYAVSLEEEAQNTAEKITLFKENVIYLNEYVRGVEAEAESLERKIDYLREELSQAKKTTLEDAFAEVIQKVLDKNGSGW